MWIFLGCEWRREQEIPKKNDFPDYDAKITSIEYKKMVSSSLHTFRKCVWAIIAWIISNLKAIVLWYYPEMLEIRIKRRRKLTQSTLFEGETAIIPCCCCCRLFNKINSNTMGSIHLKTIWLFLFYWHILGSLRCYILQLHYVRDFVHYSLLLTDCFHCRLFKEVYCV